MTGMFQLPVGHQPSRKELAAAGGELIGQSAARVNRNSCLQADSRPASMAVRDCFGIVDNDQHAEATSRPDAKIRRAQLDVSATLSTLVAGRG